MPSPGRAIDAVIADIRHHRITPDRTGLYTLTRHIELLCQLAARTANDAEFQLTRNIADLPPLASLAVGTSHLGRAVAHYAHALAPLLHLRAEKQETGEGWHDSKHRGALHVHLDGAREALADARTALSPAPASGPVGPVASAPAPPYAPGRGGRA